MELTLLVFSEAKRDVVEVRPFEQLVIKVDGSRRLTIKNRRFVVELDPRKTSWEDKPPKSKMEPPPV